MIKRQRPTLASLDLSRFSNCISYLQESAAACERAIAALGQAQTTLKPGPLERFLVLLECDVAVCMDNQICLIADLEGLIEGRIAQANGGQK